jgi:DNA replication and repair protein RecF
VSLHHLDLTDFRLFAHAAVEPDEDGTTVLTGPNGTGKTTVLEAVAYLGTQRSFRGAPKEVLLRTGAERAILRAQLDHDGRSILVEAEIAAVGRSRVQVNRQPVQQRRTLAEAVPVTIFSPEDLVVVQGGPAHRRDLLDDALRLLDPRYGSMADEVERILRQRAALLRQSGGRVTPDVEATLDVWDERLAGAGESLAQARTELAVELNPLVTASYQALTGRVAAGVETVELAYQRSWEATLAEALVASRRDDLRRGVTTVGPHRDELSTRLNGRDARVQASQGEQRCLALALRLGVHELVTVRVGSPPILLLDDVFSELDPVRSRALVRELPAGQTLLTTASPLPDGVSVAKVVDVRTIVEPGRG